MPVDTLRFAALPLCRLTLPFVPSLRHLTCTADKNLNPESHEKCPLQAAKKKEEKKNHGGGGGEIDLPVER